MTLRIFLSCELADDALAAQIASLLAGHGCQVWRHQERSMSAEYRAATSRAIQDAHIVVALWSKDSSHSSWVIDEADAGRKKGAIVVVEVGEVRAPLGFAGVERVRVASSAAALRKHDETEIWEAVSELADASGQSGARRVWLDRSPAAVFINVATNLYLFELIALAAALAGAPGFLQGRAGQLFCLLPAITSVGFGYGGDWLAQKLGTLPRAYRKRLRFRWGAEVVGAGIGVFCMMVIIDAVGVTLTLKLALDLLEGGVGAAVVTCVATFGLLAAKFIPMLASKRLQQHLLARPG